MAVAARPRRIIGPQAGDERVAVHGVGMERGQLDKRGGLAFGRDEVTVAVSDVEVAEHVHEP